MKVYIGPYKDWWVGPYQIADSLKYLGVSDSTCYKIAKAMPPWVSNACEFIYKHNPLAKRKVYVKIDKYDTWNMDSTLANIILPMLKQLKATKHGIPSHFFSDSADAQLRFDFYEDNHFKDGEAQWNVVLDKMIFAFDHIVDDSWEDAFSTGEFDRTKDLCSEGWKGTYVCDYDGIKAVTVQIQEGLELFGKYYRNLWD